MCCIFLKLDSLRYATLAESSIMNYWSQIFSTCRILIVFQNVTFRLRNRYFFSKNETPFPCQKSTPFWPENLYRVPIHFSKISVWKHQLITGGNLTEKFFILRSIVTYSAIRQIRPQRCDLSGIRHNPTIFLGTQKVDMN